LAGKFGSGRLPGMANAQISIQVREFMRAEFRFRLLRAFQARGKIRGDETIDNMPV
jgi:hypothetical protein